MPMRFLYTVCSCWTGSLLSLCCLRTLRHLEPQQGRLGAAHGGRLVSPFLVEGIAALVESVNLSLAFLLLE